MWDMSELSISELLYMYVQNDQRRIWKVPNIGYNIRGDAHDSSFIIIHCILASKYIIDGSFVSFILMFPNYIALNLQCCIALVEMVLFKKIF